MHGNVAVALAGDEHNGRRRCGHCTEILILGDNQSVSPPVRDSSGWFCSEECLRRFRRRAAGEEVEPYYGEQLEQGFRMLNASHDTDW